MPRLEKPGAKRRMVPLLKVWRPSSRGSVQAAEK